MQKINWWIDVTNKIFVFTFFTMNHQFSLMRKNFIIIFFLLSNYTLKGPYSFYLWYSPLCCYKQDINKKKLFLLPYNYHSAAALVKILKKCYVFLLFSNPDILRITSSTYLLSFPEIYHFCVIFNTWWFFKIQFLCSF